MTATILATFLAATVEWVEAYTILLAVALSIGWRRSLGAAAAALSVLAVLTIIGSLGLAHIGNLAVLQFMVAGFLLAFGLRWLAKAIARAAGVRPLHDEDAAFASLRASPEMERAGGAWIIAFNGVLLEGLEVWFLVVTLGVQTHHTMAAATAALAALAPVIAAGLALRKPLADVPENAIKYIVGCGMLAFAVFWLLEALGIAWPFADASLAALFALNIIGGLIIIILLKRRII